jgi:pyruvate/oxaloacetate carboxyltransferase
MTPDYVYNAMIGNKSVRTGVSFMDIAMDGLATGDGRTAANAVMDALWVDDPPVGADEELESLVLGADDEHDLATIAAEWGTRHFRSTRS